MTDTPEEGQELAPEAPPLAFAVTCPACGKERLISLSGFRGIKYGQSSGLCMPCARARLTDRRRQHAARTFSDRFWTKVSVGKPDACWPWIPARDGEYGKFMVRKHAMRSAHRVAWELTRSHIPEGLCVLHRCDNPPCVNPAHLFLGTVADNSRDMVAKGRKRGGVPRSFCRICGKSAHGLGYCDTHYRRIQRWGNPLVKPTTVTSLVIEEAS